MSSLKKLLQVTLSPAACEALVRQYLDADQSAIVRVNRETAGYVFSCLPLSLAADEVTELVQKLGAQVDAEFVDLRLHEFRPEHRASEHVDNIHPGCDSFIMRLDANGPSRFKVEGTLVDEERGRGYLLPEGTPHEVVTGDHLRYTLVGWCKPRMT